MVGTVAEYDSLDEAVKACQGKKYFLKTNTIGNRSCIDAEEEGLNAIARTQTIATPEIYCKGTDRSKGISFLMTELIEEGTKRDDTWIRMGHEFADMHMADASGFVSGGKYGFLHDNYIGATKQINTPKDGWIDFYRECRLEPQVRMAGSALDPYMKDIIRLMDRLDDLLTEPESPSLLHGDMWGGNHLVGPDGSVVLIDPAAYVGHAEADMAMTVMFSPLPRDFYRGYHEKIPVEDGYEDRKDVYNLYHFLNHFNLFGGSYLAGALRIVRRFA